MRAERVIVVSLQKSGTHLIQELMVALGYGMYGQSRIPSTIRPVFDDITRMRIAELVLPPDELEQLAAEADHDLFLKKTDQAWEGLGWSWQYRFGLPLTNRYGTELAYMPDVAQALQHAAGTDFVSTPANVCWIFHELDIRKLDGRFLREWSATGEPRIIFNYRDPRDVILSMVNYLSGGTGRGFGAFSEFQVFGRILQEKETLEEKLTYALSDTSFPCHGDLERSLWMLHHPDVCKVSFEELIGPRGGGTRERQLDAVARVTRFLDCDTDSVALAERIYNPQAFTFFKGAIGGWREHFTPAHITLAEQQFGAVLKKYSYT